MTPRRYAHDAARLAFAAVGVAAIAYMVAYLKTTPGAHFRPGNFFSFFTIQTNLFAIATLCAVVVVRREERCRLVDAVRGAVTLYISITGVVSVDVAAHGYGRVLLNAVVLAVAFALGALGFVLLGNWRARPIIGRDELPATAR